MSTASSLRAQPSLEDVAVLIPAWQPDAALLSLVPELIYCGFSAILVVDDGNGPEYQGILETIAGYPEAHLLQHEVHRGKGRALKTGMRYFLNTFPDFYGVVTASADGQHTPADILLTVQAWNRSPRRMMLGARQFSGAVPWRSRWAHGIVRQVFGLLTGKQLTDTQWGLHALPAVMIPELLILPGEGYEYETVMLAHVCRFGYSPVEVPIQTVYREGNWYLPVHPIRNFLRLCFALFRFYVSHCGRWG